MAAVGRMGLKGDITFELFRNYESAVPSKPLSLAEIVYYGFPRTGLEKEVFAYKVRNLKTLWRGASRALVAQRLGMTHLYGALSFVRINPLGNTTDFGLVSMRVITTAGITYFCDSWRGSQSLPNMRFHGFGNGGGVESAGDVALASEFTTQYQTNSTRPTGTLANGANNNAAIFRTVGIFTPDVSCTVTEHGLFSNALVGSGSLFDHTFVTAFPIPVGFSLAAQYDMVATGS